MSWNKETERFLNEYQNGTIPSMKDNLESLLFPFDFNNLEHIRDDWKTLQEYELKIEDYNLIALDASDNTDSALLRKAIKDVLFINERIKAKRAFAKDTLEKAVIEYQGEFSKYFSENNLPALQESKLSLRKISSLAKSIDYTELLQQTNNFELLSEKKIARLLEEENNRKEQRLLYDTLVSNAEKDVRKKISKDDLLKRRQELYELSLLDDSSEPFVDREKITTLLTEYDTAIANHDRSLKRKKWSSLLTGLGFVALLGAGYFSYTILNDKRNSMREQLALKKELSLSELENEHNSYVASVDALEKKYSALTSQLDEKKVEYASLSLQLTKKKDVLDSLVKKQDFLASSLTTLATATSIPAVSTALTHTTTSSSLTELNASTIVNHLAPVLDDAKFTLYVEKEGNTTYLIENSASEYRVHGPFRHTDARNPARKISQGQMSTPEGLYDITNFSYFGDDKQALFGRGFWKINYPNKKDLSEGASGSGVGLCSSANYSIDQAIKNGLDVMNSGVAFSDNDFETIKHFIGDGKSTQVVIENYAKRPLTELR